MHGGDNAVTGIPIEYLFAVLAALVSIIYWDIRRELKILRKESSARGTKLTKVGILLSLVCRKVGVPFGSILNDDDNDNESGV